MSRVAITLLAVTLGALGLAAAATAAPAEFAGASADGQRVFFTSSGNLVQGDTDNGFADVYERFYDGAVGIESLVTREISTGPTGGNDSYNVSFDGVSEDGTYVFFSTAESLVEEDHDHSRDVYQRNTENGETALLSGGAPGCAPCGDAELPVTFVGAAKTGSDVFFTTTEGLVEGDQDGSSDVYVREADAAAPVLVSAGGAAPATFLGTGPAGAKVVFETSDQLSAADQDSEADIYERDLSGETTQLVSLGGTCPPPLTAEECAPVYHATTQGGFVVFETKAQLTGEDHDKKQDVYRWSPTGTVALVSTGSEGEEGEGEHDAVYAGTATEGTTVYFETAEKLSASDGDSASDVYAWIGGSTSLVSTGNADLPATFNWASADGSAVLFSTEESLQGSDHGAKVDVYERKGAGVELASAGSSEFDSTFAGSSGDGSHVFFVTPQPLDPADQDANPDIYEWTKGSAPAWISTGPEGGNGAFTPHLSAVSLDGSHAIFTTREKLTEDDGNGSENDVYDHHGGNTILVSVGNSAQLQLGPPSPSLTGVTPASPNESVEPHVLGQAEGGTLIKVYPTADCSGAPAGTGSASELKSTGIKATVKAGSTTTFHATATNGSGDTSACSASSVTYVQQSAPPPPPAEEKQEGGATGGSGGTTSPGGSGSTGTDPGSGRPKSGGGTPAVIKIGNVLYVAPITRITLAPLSRTHVRRPIFQFIDTTEQPNTDFFCRLDRQKWRGCSSPYRPKHRLSLGKHVFTVKGRSFAGQWEQHPVVRRFKVVGR
jgi:hypothetical protein